MQTLLATRPIGRHASLIVLPAALLAAHCGGTQSQSLTNPSKHSAVVALRVGVAGNAAPTIAPGGRLQLWAAATYADGASGDVTNAALWQSSNPAVATVSREGLLSAAAEGTVDVKATIDRISGSLRAEIRRGGCESATLSADALVFNAFGSYSSVKVATPLSDCRWTARSDADWLRMSGRDRTVYDPGTSGSGSFAYTVLANNFPVSRSGRITVSFANGGELIHSVAQEPPVSWTWYFPAQ